MSVRYEQLVEFADAYHAALVTEPHRAVTAAAEALGLSRATATRRLAAARTRGLITDSLHQPRHVRWASGDEPSWLACVTCRHPWPCRDADPELRGAGQSADPVTVVEFTQADDDTDW